MRIPGIAKDGFQVQPELAACVGLAIECPMEFKHITSAIVVSRRLTDVHHALLRGVGIGISNVETAHEWKHTSAVERDAHTEYVKGNLSGESDMEFTFAITAHAKSRLEAFDFASDGI